MYSLRGAPQASPAQSSAFGIWRILDLLPGKLGKLTSARYYTCLYCAMKLCLVCNFQFSDEQEICPKDYSKLVPLGKDQLLGKVIQDRYRIENVIAKGSMGVVYKATHELIGRQVAVKVLHAYLVADEESLKRFQKEAKAASRLNHPNITTMYDYGVLSTGQPYIVMDLLKGSTLGDVLKDRDYLPLEEALVIFHQVCDALSEAHKRGVVHRDIKPDNIVLEYTDKGVNVKVVDFGIAKFLQQQDNDTIGKITKTGTVCGSPTYMSPEQCDDNKVDQRSDIYSLGVVLYETITGKVPFSGQDIYNVMTMHVKDPVPPLRQIRPDITYPPHLEAVIDKVLAKTPEARYQTVDEFFEALAGRGESARPPSAGTTTASQQMSNSLSRGQVSVETPRITEGEVKKMVSRALEKRLKSEGSAGDPDSAKKSTNDSDSIRDKVMDMTPQTMPSLGSSKPQSNRRSRATPGLITRTFGLLERVLPLFITLALFGSLYWLVTHEALINSVLDKKIRPMLGPVTKSKPQNQKADAQDLIVQSKFSEARALLEKGKKDGKLSPEALNELNTVYDHLARKEIKAKHYKQAVALLQLITPDGKNEAIKGLIKKYKKLASQ